MASTYSPNLRLELIGTGDQQGTWGVTTNTNLGTLLEEAIGGYVSVTVSDSVDTTLTTSNGATDQSRNMVINLTGSLTNTRNVICPAIEKLYVVKNATTGSQSVVFKVSGQTGITIPNGATYFLYVDGTDVRQINGSMAAQNSNNVAITGGSINNVTSSNVAVSNSSVSNSSLSNVSVVANASSLSVRDSDGSNILSIAVGSNLTSNRVLTLTTGDAARTLDISAGNVTISTAGATLIDDADAAEQRTTLGLGTIATQNSNNVTITGGSITGITDIALADGGTGASLSDPNADAILGWNDTAGVMRFFTAGTGITINATANTISATATGGTNVQTFNASGTWNKPAGSFNFYRVELWGAGGSGARYGASGAGGGGGGGGYAVFEGLFTELGNTETVTVGLGGAARTSNGLGGITGGFSSLTRTSGTTLTVYGGAGATDSSLTAGGGGGSITAAGSGVTSGGPDAGTGGASGAGAAAGGAGGRGAYGGGGGGGSSGETTFANGAGGASGMGGGGGGAGAMDSSPGAGAGGASAYGGAGGAGGFDTNAATAGTQPGGGGGGSEVGNSGKGGDGRVIVTVW